VRRFREADGFTRAARFGEVVCAADLPVFGEPLKTSDSQLASLTSIGRNTDAAIAAITTRRHPPKPSPTNFLPDDRNPYVPQSCFEFNPFAAS
jgi:hypothetical protein